MQTPLCLLFVPLSELFQMSGGPKPSTLNPKQASASAAEEAESVKAEERVTIAPACGLAGFFTSKSRCCRTLAGVNVQGT